MNTTKKLTIAVVALALSLVLVVGGTLAFLVAQSDVVTNTFTYGEITITLTETEGTDLGNGKREFGKIIPGDAVNKNPVVTVVAGSEKCHVYVLIDNQLGNDATYNIGSEWTKVEEDDTKVLYRYKDEVDATSEAQELPVFTVLTFADDLEKKDLDALANKNVVISAYAHQSENIDNVTVADNAAIAWAEVTPATP